MYILKQGILAGRISSQHENKIKPSIELTLSLRLRYSKKHHFSSYHGKNLSMVLHRVNDMKCGEQQPNLQAYMKYNNQYQRVIYFKIPYAKILRLYFLMICWNGTLKLLCSPVLSAEDHAKYSTKIHILIKEDNPNSGSMPTGY